MYIRHLNEYCVCVCVFIYPERSMETVISAIAEYFDICGDKISHCDLVAKPYGHVEGGSRFLGNYLHDMTTRKMSVVFLHSTWCPETPDGF